MFMGDKVKQKQLINIYSEVSLLSILQKECLEYKHVKCIFGDLGVLA